MHADSVVDVVVIGGGVAGAITTGELAQRGITTLMVDRRSPRAVIGEVLSPGVRARLESVWVDLEPAVRPIHEVAICWGDDTEYTNASMMHALGAGWTIDRCSFDRALREHAALLGAEIMDGTVSELTREPGLWQLGLDDGSCHTAQYVVDATGRAALTMQEFGSRTLADDLRVTVEVVPDTPTPPRLSVTAERDGWWYSVPTTDGAGCILARLTDADLSSVAGDVGREASMAIADWHDDRLVPVGDALVSFDPLSGNGLGFGVVSAQEAANVVQAALSGDRTAIDRYRSGARRLYDSELTRRRDAYRDEQRWPGEPFWQRRHAG